MRGSEVKLLLAGGVITELKNKSVSVSRTPSATPVDLLKVRIRPLTATMNCVGPTAPMVSGGKAAVSVRTAPVKVVPIVCGARGAGFWGSLANAVAAAGDCASLVDRGFWGRSCRLRTCRGEIRGVRRGGVTACRAMICSTVSWIPLFPTTGTPTRDPSPPDGWANSAPDIGSVINTRAAKIDREHTPLEFMPLL